MASSLMRVALDTSALYTTQAGIARYIRGLLRGLDRLGQPDLMVSPLAWPVENFHYQQPVRALKTFYREIIWANLAVPRLLYRNGIQVWHSTGTPLLLARPPIRNVITLHDLAVLTHPERFRPWHRYSTTQRLKSLKRAQRIICVSQFTANEAMRRLGLAPAIMEVVHNGCDFHPAEPPPAEASPAANLPDRFFLFVGSLEPGKNLALLEEAYRLAGKEQPQLPDLVILGARWPGVAKEQAPPKGWHYLGRQSDAVLVYLYRRAVGLVFPSKYEGFGLPVAEAMALGCPVICSRVASLPEVAGEASLYASLDAESYLEAMRSLSQNSALRDLLIQKGIEQARKFSWTKCAEATAEVYRQALHAREDH